MPQNTDKNALYRLGEFGQSPWLDYIRRTLLTSGELKAMLDRDGLKGMTSNPAIFEKAIGDSGDYTEFLEQIGKTTSDPKAIYEALAIEDVKMACEIMSPVYAATKKKDGYVSLEVSPYLAHDTAGTIEEARRLWAAVGKPNLLIKVPATPEGVPAIRELISAGINVNVTLLFAVAAYEKVAHAYIEGLKIHAQGGGDLSHVASVASFFVSRIDAVVDKELEAKLKAGGDEKAIKPLLGKVAIANAKIAYVSFQKIFAGPEWEALAKKDAQKQRLLWASTGTKNKAYKDTLYVEELIGPDTVNTIPPATYDAFRDHGQVRASLKENLGEAPAVLAAFKKLGGDFKKVTDDLLDDGVKQFATAFDKLLGAVKTEAPAAPAKTH
jgi:transaldolase/glucose-6-phosphate isomerase